MILKLKKPVSVGEQGQTITELNLREEVCGGDLRGVKLRLLDDGDLGPLLTIGGRLCGQPDVVISRLCWEDVQALASVVTRFLAGGETSTTSTAG